MKKYLLLLLSFFIISCPLAAQVSIGYFPFQSELSLSTNSERFLWGDVRVATNTFFGNVTVEPVVMVNIKTKEMVNIYGGIGMNFNFFNAAANIPVINGYTLHIGTRVKPLKKLNNLQLIFELSPYVNNAFDSGLLRTRLGLAYQFKKKKSSTKISK